MKKGLVMIVSVLIVLAVIIILVFITINKKKDSIAPVNQPASELVNQKAVEDQKINMENTQKIDGVEIIVLKEGAGVAVKAGDIASMNYTGTLDNGTIFDSNVNPKFGHVEPFDFTLGAGQVIKGWDVGVDGMKVGEKRKLVLSPDFAYGSTGAGGLIPPNATLTFEVELLAIKK